MNFLRCIETDAHTWKQGEKVATDTDCLTIVLRMPSFQQKIQYFWFWMTMLTVIKYLAFIVTAKENPIIIDVCLRLLSKSYNHYQCLIQEMARGLYFTSELYWSSTSSTGATEVPPGETCLNSTLITVSVFTFSRLSLRLLHSKLREVTILEKSKTEV